MYVHIRKYISNLGQVKFYFDDFPYIDGIDMIADIFCEKFNMTKSEKIDGFWLYIIILKDSYFEYSLCWHEDYGNYIYSEKQDEKSNEELEKRLTIVVEKLNAKLDALSKKTKKQG